MKILQTLGRHGGQQEGIFQYRRTTEGVFIDSAVGQAQLAPPSITVATQEWAAILETIRRAPQDSFGAFVCALGPIHEGSGTHAGT